VSGLPLVSIVTPCLNMAPFLETTIESVLAQDYPNLEYIVIDGGSTDGSVEILARHGGRLRFSSGPDGGTADAVNRGFRQSRGSIFAFLSADDLYAPGAVSAGVRHLTSDPGAGGVYGEAVWLNAAGEPLGPYPTREFDREQLARECFICQPACFLRREVFEEAGMLDPSLRSAFDYDLWIRVAARHRLRKIGEWLAFSRMHRRNKSLGERRRMFSEVTAVLRKHYAYVPFSWLYGYCCYLVDGRDQFYEPLRPSMLKYALSLPFGLAYNPRQPLRYWKDWSAAASFAGLWRRWNAVSPPGTFGIGPDSVDR